MSTQGFKFYPETVVWEITFACNMRCVHCGTSAGKRRSDELTTDESLSLIDELTGLGCKSITISGGEPLLREDWPVLAARMRENGLTTYLISNGYTLNKDMADRFLELGIKRVGISIDGTEEVHNKIRRMPDSFARCLRALDTLRETGVDSCVVTQVNGWNLPILGDLHELLIDHGCKGWRIQMCTVTGRMQEHADMALTLTGYEQLVDKLLALRKDGRLYVDVGENVGYYGCKGSELIDGNPYFGCYAGMRVAGIESNGNVKGCLSMPPQFVEGNLRDSSFTEIWNRPDGFAYNRQFTQDSASGACHDCRYLPLCRGGCTTTSVSQTGHRADNPYCMYQIERDRGIAPRDSENTLALLRRFNPEAVESAARESGDRAWTGT
jgi:radical SAM protein with 4Fe4S-binding SPASM domain